MQFKLNKSELKSALTNVGKAIAVKSDINVLEGVLFQLKQGEMKLTGYDLTEGMTTTISAESSFDEGSFIIQPKLLSGMINKLSSADIEFFVENETMAITSGKTKLTLSVINANSYPALPDIENSQTIEISQPILKSMINQTIFAVATTDTKPILTGELFKVENNMLDVAAIDGYRLAVRTEELQADNTNIVVPAKALNKVSKLLSDKENDTCTISISKKYVTFTIGNYTVFTRLVTGEFHNYKASIPKSNSTEVTINCKELVDSLERCSLLINDRIKAPVRCVFENGQVSISLKTQIGKINDTIECDIVGGKIEIGFNVRYFLDALKVIEDSKITLLLNGSNTPMTIKGDNYTMLVLPVRLKNE